MDMRSTLAAIEAMAAINIKPEEGDYVVDDILYCGKCRTPKQAKIEFMGEIRRPFCLCKCAVEKREAEEREQKRRDFLDRVKSLRASGFPDAEMQRWTFANDDRSNARISDIAQKYVEHFDEMRRRGKGLLLFGDVGTGKTFAAACIANALIDKGVPCLVTSFARLVNTLQGMYDGRQDYIDGLNRFPLLVIDDLASERDTEYMNEIVYNVIDSRYRSGLPLIVTTNLTGDELKHAAEITKKRIYSRLFEMCVPIEVKGVDRRKMKLKQDYSDLEEILGL